jgi:hypothetical protein
MLLLAVLEFYRGHTELHPSRAVTIVFFFTLKTIHSFVFNIPLIFHIRKLNCHNSN